MPLTPRVAVFPEGPGVGADPEQARACRPRAFWPQRSARQGRGLLVPGVPVQSPMLPLTDEPLPSWGTRLVSASMGAT